MSGPMTGIKIIELCRVVSVRRVTDTVGDQHTDVIKVEVPAPRTAAALAVGFEADSLTTEGGTASEYMAELHPTATNIIADRRTRRLGRRGCQGRETQ
ncbi:MAG: hypothetical protein ACRDTK_00180 [Mycobacterium sp.]